MSQRVSVVAVWLLVAYALADRRVPECQNRDCKWDNARTDAETGYIMDEFKIREKGNYIKIHAKEGELYRAECSGIRMMDAAWPRFNYQLTVKEVQLLGCLNLGVSYGLAMEQMKITFTDTLRVMKFDNSIKTGPVLFKDLPLTVKELELSRPDGLVELAEGTLDNLSNVRKLVLKHVRPKALPPHLDELKIKDIEWETFPMDELNVSKLEVSDTKMHSMKLTVPNLRNLTFRNVPKLFWLELNETPHALMKDMLVEFCGGLTALIFTKSKATSLPGFLLGHATNLNVFGFKQGQITTLPPSFFSDSKALRFINLSGNRLASLPRGLFNGLTNLVELRLSDNCLGVSELSAMAPLNVLQWLDLSGNPLNDLCSNAIRAPLTSLSSLPIENLYLSRTRTSHICVELLRAFPRLRYMDLRDNSLANISCANMLAWSGWGSDNVVIDVSNNPVNRMTCSNEAVNASVSKLALLVTEINFDCTCDCPNALCLPVNFLRSSHLQNNG